MNPCETAHPFYTMDVVYLVERDLPPINDNYLKIISARDFVHMEQQIIKVYDPYGGYLRRLYVVVPLRLNESDDDVIPIPFLIDTGAPGYLHLGRGARNALRQLKILREANNRMYPYSLKGTLFRGRKYIEDPWACELNVDYEPNPNDDEGDCRTNLLGILALQQLEIDITW